MHICAYNQVTVFGTSCSAPTSGRTTLGGEGLQHQDGTGHIVAASDYVRSLPESIRAYIPAGRSYKTLGTDGFGRSDTRANLRKFFQVDTAAITAAAVAYY